MIIVLHGHDELGIRRRIAELREQADGGTGLLDSNATTIEGRDAKADEILGAALTVPFLAPHRFVLVSGLLGRFGSGERPPEGRGAGRAPSIEPFEPLFAQLNEGLPETTILVFEDGPLSERNAFLARLRAIEGTEVEFFAELKAADLVRFIRDEASARGVRFRAGKSTRPLEPGDEWQRPGESDPAPAPRRFVPRRHAGALAGDRQARALHARPRGDRRRRGRPLRWRARDHRLAAHRRDHGRGAGEGDNGPGRPPRRGTEPARAARADRQQLPHGCDGARPPRRRRRRGGDRQGDQAAVARPAPPRDSNAHNASDATGSSAPTRRWSRRTAR